MRFVSDTYRANRAFHGWGHQFLYSRPFPGEGPFGDRYVDTEFFAFGVSNDRSSAASSATARRRGRRLAERLERRGRPAGGRPDRPTDPALLAEIEQEFVRYVRSGH
jgi:hypothetical protein